LDAVPIEWAGAAGQHQGELMNRSWITACTLAAVVGSGAACVGVITGSNEQPVAASPEPTAAPATPVDVTPPQLDAQGTVAYRLKSVGVVTVQVAGGTVTVVSSVADNGWETVGSNAAGTHAEARFTDGVQLVTFTADLSGSDVMVAVTNVAVAAPVDSTPASTSTVSTEPDETVPVVPAPSVHPAAHTTAGDENGERDDDGMERNDD
jgi:hypothetical protein